MTEFYDALETRSADAREAALLAALPAQVAAAQRTPAFASILAGIDARAVGSRAALAQLPVTRKSELLARQQLARSAAGGDPFGGFSAIGWRSLAGGAGRARGARRVFQSPGPIYEPEGHGADYWRFARALFAAGFRDGDLVHNSFGYHLTPAGSMMETAALALGCTVFPGGVGNTELQLQAMAELRPEAYAGTPSFLRIALEKAEAAGQALSIRKASVGGEAFPAALRDWLAQRGIAAYQSYGTADLGLIAYETEPREGLVLDEQVIVEIVRPGTHEPVGEGEVGEVVVTALNADYPLVRFGTGDLSALLPGRCPSGRSAPRIRGWLGRADQTAKVRGLFVHPAQVAELMKRHPEIGRVRLVVSGEMANDRMTLKAESADPAEGLADRLATSVRELTKLRAEVELHPSGSLPNDGKLIEDLRSVG
ncbi:MAG TPA: AMP-binding protein [Methylibium sp.]|uniref:phenylacetate--CoA ligase family protein n=1 Tax=Methylibium sp. TaxID=2067992 RepID=UPI002DB9FB91|nr:AMP-binding protein [Methylibium sp.]HEU4459216.1 AMP-binding protein [Methylibium sp.]